MSDQKWFFDIEILDVKIRLDLEVSGKTVTAGLDKSVIPPGGLQIGSLGKAVTAFTSKLGLGTGFSLAAIKNQIAPDDDSPFAGVIKVIDDATMTLTDLSWVSSKSFTIRLGALASGTHTVTLRVADEGDNEGFGEAQFVVP